MKNRIINETENYFEVKLQWEYNPENCSYIQYPYLTYNILRCYKCHIELGCHDDFGKFSILEVFENFTFTKNFALDLRKQTFLEFRDEYNELDNIESRIVVEMGY